MRIAVGGLHTECSTYTDVLQTTGDFKVLRGNDLMISDFFSFLPNSKAEIVPLLHARSTPGGAVARITYDLFKTEFLQKLEFALSQGPIDGLYLAMHGAVHVEGMLDAEGDWLSAARRLVGPDCPISVSYDLHGNLSQQIIDQIDIFTAFRHAPHIDTLETMERALNHLISSIETGKRPFVGWAPIPVLLPGERTSTVDEPAKSLYAQLDEIDKVDGILDASLMVGYVWADVSRATAAAVVSGYDQDAVQQEVEKLAQSYFDSRADFAFGPITGSLEDMLFHAQSCGTGPVVLTDSGDNPGGGAQFTRLRAVVSAENNPDTREIRADTFDETSQVFIDALADALPDVSRTDLIWRSQFLLGSLYFTLVNSARITRLSGGEINGEDTEEAINQIVDAAAWGLLGKTTEQDQ